MDNNNNQNQNGKEVHHTLRNGQKEGGARPVNKIKKNNTVSEIRPAQPKKIPLNTNRPSGNQRKNGPKGQVIKLGDKENKIHPVDRPVRENNRTYPKTASANTANTAVREPIAADLTNNTTSQFPDKAKFSISDKTGNWLLIIAVIFLIAWAVTFFYYHVGGNSHMLLGLAVICAVISLAGRRGGKKSSQ